MLIGSPDDDDDDDYTWQCEAGWKCLEYLNIKHISSRTGRQSVIKIKLLNCEYLCLIIVVPVLNIIIAVMVYSGITHP